MTKQKSTHDRAEDLRVWFARYQNTGVTLAPNAVQEMKEALAAICFSATLDAAKAESKVWRSVFRQAYEGARHDQRQA